MARSIRALVALDQGMTTERVAPYLPQDASIDVVGVVEGLQEAAIALENTPADVIVVGAAGYSDRALYFIENARRQDPKRPVLVLTEGSTNGFVARVFEFGADDLLILPQPRDAVAFAIHKAMARVHVGARGESDDASRLIVVLGPKGGTGKTLTTTNLAVALQERGKSVAVVDLDLQFGDVALSMGVAPRRTIHEIVASQGSLDIATLEGALIEHSSGVKILLAPTRPDRASGVTVELVREICGLLRQSYDYVLVDTPPGFTAEVIATIDMSTDVVMVGMLDALSLKNTKLGLETLDLMGYPAHHITLLLNRAHSRVGISSSDVTAVLGREPDVFVPSDREIPRTINEGVPITISGPRSEAALAFRALASRYTGDPVPELAEAGAEPADSTAAERSGLKIFRRRS